MDKKMILKDRFEALLDHYRISVKDLTEKIGGSRATYFNIKNGSSQPDFRTTMAILEGFPEISAEWWVRGDGPMLKGDIVSQEEADALRAENRAIKAMYKAEVAGKHKDAAMSSPERDRILRKDAAKQTLSNVRRGGRKEITRPLSGRVQGVQVPSLLELFKQD